MTLPIGPVTSRRMATMLREKRELFRYDQESTWARRRWEAGALDFVEGNPHELPPSGFADALARQVEPRDPDWFGYKVSERQSRAVVAASLRELRGLPFEDADIQLTTGAFAGLAVALAALVDPGDEVIFFTPAWFWYDTLIAGAGGTPARLRLQAPSFDLDPDVLAATITPRTRAVIINTPHNPTGRIFQEASLRAVAHALTEASMRIGRPIFLIADESYCRVVYDDRPFVSPTSIYPWSLLVYTYGKTLLTPGQRIGYLAAPPGMPIEARKELRAAIPMAQRAVGYAFPNALLQHALPELERLSIDMAHYAGKRDLLVSALREFGYDVQPPEATFYVLARSPWVDDLAFVELLARDGVYVLPGSLMDLPGSFRVSLTASVDMIERALPSFQKAFVEAGRGAGR